MKNGKKFLIRFLNFVKETRSADVWWAGNMVVYIGWAWTMDGDKAQKWTSEFLNNLKGGATVQQAYDQFRLGSEKDRKFMETYGQTDHVIDKTTKKDNSP